MSTGLYTHRTRNAGEIVTDVLYNTAHKNQWQNDVPDQCGALSDDLTAYQATQDPAPGGLVNMVLSVLEEFQQLRFALADIKTALNGDVPLAQWYTPVAVSPSVLRGRGARVYRNTTQSLTFKTPTACIFTTVRYDTGVTDPGVDPFFSLTFPTRLTAKTTGLYQITGYAEWATGSAGPLALFIRRNGVTLLAASEWVGDGVQPPYFQVGTQYLMTQGDYVELLAFQTATNPFNIVNPEFGLELLNPSVVIAPPTQHLLAITEIGTGAGTVTSDVGPIACPGTCSAQYADGAIVTLTATPTSGGFVEWDGDVPGAPSSANPIVLTMDQARAVTVRFTAFTLSIIEAGTGSGVVTSDIGAINCPGVCSDAYAPGDVVQLTATATAGVFANWTGDLISTLNPDSLTMDADKTVTATFSLTGMLASQSNSAAFSGTRYACPSTLMSLQTTAGAAAFESPIDMVIESLYITLDAVIPGGQTFTAQFNLNGIDDAGIVVSMVAGDRAKLASGTVTVLEGVLVCVKLVQAGGGTAGMQAINIGYRPV